jgi:hypothetical protein
MLEILLRHGVNPNEAAWLNGHHSAWQYFLKAYQVDSCYVLDSNDHYEKWGRIFKSMLQHGADITDDIGDVVLPDLPFWTFEDVIERPDYTFRTPSLEGLVNRIVAAAPKDVASSLHVVFEERKSNKMADILRENNPLLDSRKPPRKAIETVQYLDRRCDMDFLDVGDDGDDRNDSNSGNYGNYADEDTLVALEVPLQEDQQEVARPYPTKRRRLYL